MCPVKRIEKNSLIYFSIWIVVKCVLIFNCLFCGWFFCRFMVGCLIFHSIFIAVQFHLAMFLTSRIELFFCGMVDRRKAFSLISSRDHCQRSSPSRISDTSRARYEPAQNLNSDFDEWSCAVAIISTAPLVTCQIFGVVVKESSSVNFEKVLKSTYSEILPSKIAACRALLIWTLL